MSSDKLSRISKHMANLSFLILIGIIFFNSLCWVFPSLSNYGLGFYLTHNLISNIGISIKSLPWWQTAGGGIISGIPLFALSYGLYNLRLLFRSYEQHEYFSRRTALLLEGAGKSLLIWDILNFIFEPLLSFWLTFREESGNKVISLSFGTQDVLALFVAVCIILIAQILRRAAYLQDENRQFV